MSLVLAHIVQPGLGQAVPTGMDILRVFAMKNTVTIEFGMFVRDDNYLSGFGTGGHVVLR